MTLNPGQTATLNLSFLPTVVGAAAGQMTITSNAINAGTVAIGLSGTAETTYQVDLTWVAPANSSDPVVGYNVYRSTSGGGFRLLNAVVNVPVTFVDNNVQNGVSYAYYVTSVDSTGNESSPSNTWSAAIP
jgi:fibronectin type 3 domain-containing protein